MPAISNGRRRAISRRRVICLLAAIVTPLAGSLPTPGAGVPAVALELGAGVRMDFVLVPAGSFQMGADENTGDGDEWPEHRVTFTRPIYLGKYEVTQEQWQQVMASNPSEFKGARRPVENVSWNDCEQFLKKLAARTGRTLRLPTEAEWEYACRAGTLTPWSFGKSESAAAEFAWLETNSHGATHPVGELKPNPWGLYDLHGNVQEWCGDSYLKHAYPDHPVVDPAGPAPTEGRVLRGGAWGDNVDRMRSSARNCLGPDGHHNGIGFRCVLLP